MLVGKIEKVGRLWAATCDAVGAHTQGTSLGNACEMLADCIEVQSGAQGFRVRVTDPHRVAPSSYEVTVDSDQPELLVAELLRYQRAIHKLTAAEVARRLGSSSINAYSAYEQGKREPSISKFRELLAVVAPELAVTVGARATVRRKAG